MSNNTRNETLARILQEGKNYPTGWKATIGRDPQTYAKDCYIYHPDAGIYLLKEYAKNPMVTIGCGGKVARKIDDDLVGHLDRRDADFGILKGDAKRIIDNIRLGNTTKDILDAALNGSDKGITIPLRGKTDSEKDTYDAIKDLTHSKSEQISKDFRRLMKEEGAYSGYD